MYNGACLYIFGVLNGAAQTGSIFTALLLCCLVILGKYNNNERNSNTGKRFLPSYPFFVSATILLFSLLVFGTLSVNTLQKKSFVYNSNSQAWDFCMPLFLCFFKLVTELKLKTHDPTLKKRFVYGN